MFSTGQVIFSLAVPHSLASSTSTEGLEAVTYAALASYLREVPVSFRDYVPSIRVVVATPLELVLAEPIFLELL